MTIQESLTELAAERALEAMSDWFAHFKDCPQCNYGPFCAIGNRLDEIATMWERKLGV